MGLEKFIVKDNVYLGSSKLLGKRWVVQARDLQDAAGKIISKYKKELTNLENSSDTGDVDLDLVFEKLDDKVVEL